jgi:hypothetical protein
MQAIAHELHKLIEQVVERPDDTELWEEIDEALAALRLASLGFEVKRKQ